MYMSCYSYFSCSLILSRVTQQLIVLPVHGITFPYAGTPKGVGPVKIGQKIEAGITGLLDVHFDVERRSRVIQ